MDKVRKPNISMKISIKRVLNILELCSVQISARTQTIVTQDFGRFLQSLQANAWRPSILDHDNFHPNPYQFIIHHLSYHSMLYNLQTDIVIN
jgi:hypothetical protein